MSDPIEDKVRTLLASEDQEGATTEVIRAYGPEVLGLLAKLTGDHEAASEVFCVWSEDVWKGLKSFQWRSSLRTWVYRLARNAMHRSRRDPWQKRANPLPTREMAALEQHVRTATLVYLKTEVKDRFRALREQLSDDRKTLLVPHIDRGMSWNNIAAVLYEGDPSTMDIAREANSLRQKFHRVKAKLQRLASQQGLLSQE